MPKLKCRYCCGEFVRPPSRKALYCSFECSVNHKRRKLTADLNKETPELCYWMGFLFGDGSIDSNNKLQVCLSSKDADLLTQFSVFLFDKDYVNRYNSRCHLQYSDPEIQKPLSRYGITPDKTKSSVLILPERYKSDFIRGYFDADGWYLNREYKHKNGKYYPKCCLGICSYLLENLEIINRELPVQGKITKKKKQELYELRFQSKKDIEKVRNYLYGTPNLERKWL